MWAPGHASVPWTTHRGRSCLRAFTQHRNPRISKKYADKTHEPTKDRAIQICLCHRRAQTCIYVRWHAKVLRIGEKKPCMVDIGHLPLRRWTSGVCLNSPSYWALLANSKKPQDSRASVWCNPTFWMISQTPLTWMRILKRPRILFFGATQATRARVSCRGLSQDFLCPLQLFCREQSTFYITLASSQSQPQYPTGTYVESPPNQEFASKLFKVVF